LAIGRRGCTERDLYEKTLVTDNGRCSPVRKLVAYESDVSEGVQVTVLFCMKNILNK
jgi:hypothetical protein